MCTIEKLLIKGIRSFSPENDNVIEFYKPLTLIVGSNGAGKTTIIECLKQACTGELPPNVGGNGRNWVMDPKVAGESEVKAQIKLRLRTAVQMPVVVVRSFQSVQKKATLQFKSLDATLQTYNRDTRQREAVTYRCADINAMVPGLMGVSKAVLDSVVFVHQEESNWPLADGATIKKKFDEIFAATKYTKALESLRKLRLEKTQETREMKLKLEHLRSLKDAAQGLQADLAASQAQVARLQEEMGALEARIGECDSELLAIDDTLGQVAGVEEELSKLRAQAEVVAGATRDKLSRLEGGDFEEPDEALEQYAQEAAAEDAAAAEAQASRSHELRAKQMDCASYEERVAEVQQRLNKAQAAAEAHASNVADRDAFALTAATQLGVSLPGQQQQGQGQGQQQQGQQGQQQQLPPAALEYFRSELRRAQADLRAELMALKEAHRSREAAVSSQIDAANAELAGAQQAGAVKAADLRQLEHKRDNLSQQLVSMAAAPFRAEDVQLREEELARRLEAKRAEEARGGFEAALAEQRAALDKAAEDTARVRAERDRVIMAGDALGRLRAARTAHASSKAKLDALMLGSTARQLVELVGGPSPPPHGAELKRLADAKLREQEAAAKSRAEQLRDLEAKLAADTGELTTRRRERVAAESRCQALRSELRRAVGGLSAPLPPEVLGLLNQGGRETEAFEAAVKHLEESRDTKYRKAGRARAYLSVLQMFEEDSRRECKCVLCSREFANNQQMEDMLSNIAQQQEELPAMASQFEGETAELDRQLAALNNLVGGLQRLKELEAAVPGMRAAEEEVAKRAAEQEEQLESSREEVGIMEADLMALRRTVGDGGWQIARQAAEVDEAEAAVQAAQAAADAAGTGDLRGLEDLDAELAQLESQQRRADAARDELMRRQGRLKDERARLSEQLAAAREELRRASEADRARLEAQSQLREVDGQIQALRSAVAAARAAVAPAQSARDSLLAQRDAARQGQQAAEAELEGRVTELSSLAERFAAKQRLVDDFAASRHSAQTVELHAALEEARAARDAAAKEAAALQLQLDSAATDAADRAKTRRQVEAVLDYRRSRRQEQEIAEQIRQCEEAARQVGDRDHLRRRRQGAEAQRAAARQQRDVARGSLSVVVEHAKAARASLADKRYAHIHDKYRHQLIELKTTEMAAGDLDKYHKALERALLAFHTGKMADINKIVKELWQKTYRGADIDCIQIKADAEGTARSYNYRVVMVNGGVELDMRGRCSAGQKVLACLVIRLALAETFCLNCGILALDEPTTNLDAANSESLAAALHSVMAARAAQDNFQLVVITHDEAFAQMLGTRRHADFLWRVTKDDDQRSLISREEITE